MRLDPLADHRQPGPERPRHDVVGVADEQRAVADRREALDLLEHLRVEVGGQERLALAALGQRQPADEVGQEHERRALVLRVLVQEVVDVPRLVADPEVVGLLAHEVAEDHVVGEQDLVHLADRLEDVERVLARRGSRCADSEARPRLAGCTRSPAASSAAVSGCWASQSISSPGTSARSSRAIAMSRRAWPRPIGEDTKSARRARAERARPAARGARAGGAEHARGELVISTLTFTGSRAIGRVPGALEHHQLAARQLGDPARRARAA